jgi:hypothetical protein
VLGTNHIQLLTTFAACLLSRVIGLALGSSTLLLSIFVQQLRRTSLIGYRSLIVGKDGPGRSHNVLKPVRLDAAENSDESANGGKRLTTAD